MEHIADWLNSTNQLSEENKDDLNDSIDSFDFRNEVRRRCIVLSVCFDYKIVEQTNTIDSLAPLIEAIHAFNRKLKSDDYVCFNFGSDSKLLLCDKQQKIKENWQKVMLQYSD